MGSVPIRHIVLLMSPAEAQAFGHGVARLQEAYKVKTVVEVVRRAVEEAAERVDA